MAYFISAIINAATGKTTGRTNKKGKSGRGESGTSAKQHFKYT